MDVIPVIDLLGGVVVRGVGGRRAEYRPIESQLTTSAAPASIAAAFVRHFAASTVYVADLDAIAGAPPDLGAYQQIAAAGVSLWLDAGVRSLSQAVALTEQLNQLPHGGCLVLGLESLGGPAALTVITQAVPTSQLIFSLDLKEGEPLTSSPAWNGRTPRQIAATVAASGIERLIVLDLADVGSGAGMRTDALRAELAAAHPALQWIGGGGVRSLADLRLAATQGWHSLLVASALHDGRLTREDLQIAANLADHV